MDLDANEVLEEFQYLEILKPRWSDVDRLFYKLSRSRQKSIWTENGCRARAIPILYQS